MSPSLSRAGGASTSRLSGTKRRRLGEPGRIPERADLAPRLIARAGAAVEAVEGRRMQKQGLHHRPFSPSTRSSGRSVRRGSSDPARRLSAQRSWRQIPRRTRDRAAEEARAARFGRPRTRATARAAAQRSKQVNPKRIRGGQAQSAGGGGEKRKRQRMGRDRSDKTGRGKPAHGARPAQFVAPQRDERRLVDPGFDEIRRQRDGEPPRPAQRRRFGGRRPIRCAMARTRRCGRGSHG